MSSQPYIVNTEQPVNQNFRLLRDEGLAYIQTYSGYEWTNLNASDPGVTILDQICYALTELGYCNDFSIRDILTQPNGEIKYKNQFYTPEKILTTAPVTLLDYQKYVIDGVKDVYNAIITPSIPIPGFNGVYEVKLYINPLIKDPTTLDNICKAAFFYLNKSRNIGEFFLMPAYLIKHDYLLCGKIEMNEGTNILDLTKLLSATINDFIFPAVVPIGYDTLGQEEADINEILNGPYLTNGWIDGEAIGKKKNKINTMDIGQLLESIATINTFSGLGFRTEDGALVLPHISSSESEILFINILKSIEKGLLQIYCLNKNVWNGASMNASTLFGTPTSSKMNLVYGEKPNTKSKLPKGKYRDINTYYSIQNTFPEIFAVGADSVATNATSLQMAQSRQLKGYLTLFDQVLANQFSQLANIDKLFSFKNSLIGTPSDEAKLNALKNTFEKERSEYPVPYKVFSPTYYYQSLYDVPYIKPLLKNNDTYKLSHEPEPENVMEQRSWDAYKKDPYNPYIQGLMRIMEQEEESLLRRNQLLDHLLARHGESPLLINAYINGSTYSGNTAMDLVIFKSLYLQNLGLLSYNKQKCYNYIGSIKISAELSAVSKTYYDSLQTGDFIDFIFDVEKIDGIESLTEIDFTYYSSLELKLSLLLGLKPQYKDFIVSQHPYGNTEDKLETRIAKWMIEERKGLILIEMGLIFQSFEFELSFLLKADRTLKCRIIEQLSYTEINYLHQKISLLTITETQEIIKNGTLSIEDITYTIEKIHVLDTNESKWVSFIETTEYSFSIEAKSLLKEQEVLFTSRNLCIILPNFIPQFNTPEFINRLCLFLQYNLPIQATYELKFASATELEALIPIYANWHNSLIYVPETKNSPSHLHGPNLKKDAESLLLELAKIKNYA